jgi:hypothetical protein
VNRKGSEMKETDEYTKFVSLVGKIVSVPHSEIKAKLDAEKKAKEQKKARKSSGK